MSAFHFFFRRAGYSYNPATQGEIAGRAAGALDLARAEYLAWDRGYTFHWEVDDIDSSYFSDEQPPWRLWGCIMRDRDGNVVQSLGGIDFGRDGSPWGEPYRRVVEAELACEEVL